uniref:Uncharacterized protein n=1 Tax=Meloidogyne enterolobii TaxID=390850 RepID=A0A6V7UKT9_MELEN|nr:unnamed protein product [Meloidogyne enterolobii]
MARLFPFFHPICLSNFCLQTNKKDYFLYFFPFFLSNFSYIFYTNQKELFFYSVLSQG